MAHKKEQLVVMPMGEILVEIVVQIYDVKRKPRNTEDGDHSYQHPVRPPLPLPIGFLFPAVLRPGFASRPVVQFHRHSNVAEGDDKEREDELQRRCYPAEPL